jgi:hypothetical protein
MARRLKSAAALLEFPGFRRGEPKQDHAKVRGSIPLGSTILR